MGMSFSRPNKVDPLLLHLKNRLKQWLWKLSSYIHGDFRRIRNYVPAIASWVAVRLLSFTPELRVASLKLHA